MKTVAAAIVLAADVHAQVNFSQPDEGHIVIEIDRSPFATYSLGSSEAKPFLSPLRSATGRIVTRRFPGETVEGESRDHPHHQGWWIGYGNINNLNFWENAPDSQPSEGQPAGKGIIRLAGPAQVKAGRQSGTIVASFNWNAPDGTVILRENRTLTFYASPKVRQFDSDSVFEAPKVPARFGDTKEGFFAIRVADEMAGKNGGVITNSEGAQTEKDVWGKHADWVDYTGNVGGERVGICILDHPQNLNHPPRWHARAYGLFAVNPFGAKPFDPQTKEPGGYTLEPGRKLRLRYRVIIHSGDAPSKMIAGWSKQYAGK